MERQVQKMPTARPKRSQKDWRAREASETRCAATREHRLSRARDRRCSRNSRNNELLLKPQASLKLKAECLVPTAYVLSSTNYNK